MTQNIQPQPILPWNVTLQAAQSQLGEWRSTYVPYTIRSILITTASTLLLAFILIVILWHIGGVSLTPLPIELVLCTCLLAFQTILFDRKCIYVFVHGMILVQNNHTEVVLWERVAFVRREINPLWIVLILCMYGLDFLFFSRSEIVFGLFAWIIVFNLVGERFQVRLQNGRPFRFTRLQRHGRKLYDAIRWEMYPFLVSRILSSYQIGMSMQFGAIHINSKGIRRRGFLIRWQQIAEVRFIMSKVVVTKKNGKHVRWSDLGIPNASVVAVLANFIVNEYKAQQRILLQILSQRCKSIS